jgi:hydroxymethylbilane synthase
LEGGCQVPIGVNSSYAEASGAAGDGSGELILTGMVASLDGIKLIRDQARGSAEDPEAIGIALALKLREQGAGEILEQIFADVRPQA